MKVEILWIGHERLTTETGLKTPKENSRIKFNGLTFRLIFMNGFPAIVSYGENVDKQVGSRIQNSERANRRAVRGLSFLH